MLICISYEILVFKTLLTRLTIFFHSWKMCIWKVIYSYPNTFFKWCIRIYIHIRNHNFTKYSYSIAFACIRPHVHWCLQSDSDVVIWTVFEMSFWNVRSSIVTALQSQNAVFAYLLPFSFARHCTSVIFYSFTNNSRDNPVGPLSPTLGQH